MSNDEPGDGEWGALEDDDILYPPKPVAPMLSLPGEGLTRGQVVENINRFIMHYSFPIGFASDLLAHDAAQRAALATLQAELEGVRRENESLKLVYTPELRTIVTKEVDNYISNLQQQLAAREGQVSELEKALKIAVCPYCNDIGWTVHPDRNTGEACQVQCEWCYNKQALTKPSA